MDASFSFDELRSIQRVSYVEMSESLRRPKTSSTASGFWSFSRISSHVYTLIAYRATKRTYFMTGWPFVLALLASTSEMDFGNRLF